MSPYHNRMNTKCFFFMYQYEAKRSNHYATPIRNLPHNLESLLGRATQIVRFDMLLFISIHPLIDHLIHQKRAWGDGLFRRQYPAISDTTIEIFLQQFLFLANLLNI
jgi:hypothetical protein